VGGSRGVGSVGTSLSLAQVRCANLSGDGGLARPGALGHALGDFKDRRAGRTPRLP